MNLKTAMPIVVMFISFVVLAALPVQADFCLNGPGSHNYDTDGDGFADCEDNCPLQSNDQTDTDSDGIGDVCDCGITVPVNNGHDLRVAISGAPADCAI